MVRLLVLVLGLTAGAAGAGPWPLPKGEGHLSFSAEVKSHDASEGYATAYAEYGLGNARTLGFDFGQGEDETDKAVLFLRWPLGAPGKNTVYAYEMGLGVAHGKNALRPAFSIGQGVDLGGRAGWIALDSRAVLFEGGDGILEADLTVGAETGSGDKWLVQVQMAAPSDRGAYVKLAPSYAFRAGKGRHLLVGATAGIVGMDSVKFTLGLWQAF